MEKPAYSKETGMYLSAASHTYTHRCLPKLTNTQRRALSISNVTIIAGNGLSYVVIAAIRLIDHKINNESSPTSSSISRLFSIQFHLRFFLLKQHSR